MLLDGPATRCSTHVKVIIHLSPAQAEHLRREAERLGLTPKDLARAAAAYLLATRDDDLRKPRVPQRRDCPRAKLSSGTSLLAREPHRYFRMPILPATSV